MTSPTPPPDPARVTKELVLRLRAAARRQIEQISQDDEKAKKEALAIKKGALEEQAKAGMARLRERSFELDIGLRKVVAYGILVAVIGWMDGVLLLVGGMRVSIMGVSAEVHLSDTVAITLLGTTSVNVIGLLLVVTRYLFPRGTSDNQDLDEPKG